MSMAKAAGDKRRSYYYSVKVINTHKKSDFTVEKIEEPGIFTSATELKEKLSEVLEYSVQIISPGHGVKGKMQDLVDCKDLDEMYKCYGKRKEILLWCFKPGDKPSQEKQTHKRSHSASHSNAEDDTLKPS